MYFPPQGRSSSGKASAGFCLRPGEGSSLLGPQHPRCGSTHQPLGPLGPLLDEELLPRLLPPPGCLEDPSCYSPTPGAEGAGQVAGLRLLPFVRLTVLSFDVVAQGESLTPMPLHPSSPTGVSWAPAESCCHRKNGWKSGGMKLGSTTPTPAPSNLTCLESFPGSSAQEKPGSTNPALE